MTYVIAFLTVFGLLVVWLIVQARRAGPPQLSEADLATAMPLLSVTADSPGGGWSELGRETQADGLNLRFDHDDDPAAEATMLAPEAMRGSRGKLALARTVRLDETFATEHVHTAGYVFRVRLRGTGGVIGREVRLKMVVGGDGKPYGGRIENDDDTDAAVGDWIEIESADILQVRKT